VALNAPKPDEGPSGMRGNRDEAMTSRLVDKVVVSGGAPSGSALLLSYSPDCVDLVVGTDGQVDYLGLQGGEHRFTAWETLAVRAKAPSCVALIARA